MSDINEHLLSAVVIAATHVSQTDIALERMTHLATSRNAAAQANLARSYQGQAQSLQQELNTLNSQAKADGNTVRLLQDKFRIALEMYEEANSNTGSWINLLEKPFHEIAEQHDGFSKNYETLMRAVAEITLRDLANQKTIAYMAEKLEYSPLDVEIINYKNEGAALNEQYAQREQPTFQSNVVNSFYKDLVDANKEKYVNIKRRVDENK